MPRGAAQGRRAADDLQEQQQRSTVQMQNRSNVPTSKSSAQFQGYGGDAPLQTTEAKPVQRVVPGQRRKRPPLHPWLEYPPNFERACARNAMVSTRDSPLSIVPSISGSLARA